MSALETYKRIRRYSNLKWFKIDERKARN